jgi:hypothetical protein
LTDYQIVELNNLCSLTYHQLLTNIRYAVAEDRLPEDKKILDKFVSLECQMLEELLSYNEKKWNDTLLLLLENIKTSQVFDFVNSMNEGIKSAHQAINDKNWEKLDKVCDMVLELYNRLPKIEPIVDIMIKDIEKKLLNNHKEITVDDAANQFG